MTISTEMGRQKPQDFDGDALGRLLAGRRQTPDAIAKRIGVSRTTVKAWIDETAEPRFGHVVRLCRELGLNPDYFDKSKRTTPR